ncbi:MAG: hypothetical protein ACFWTJ_03000 [Lachnoclostridium sp.]|jgi:hypothetical protein
MKIWCVRYSETHLKDTVCNFLHHIKNLFYKKSVMKGRWNINEGKLAEN